MKAQSLFALCFGLLLPGVRSAAATEQGPEASSSLRVVSRSLAANAPGCHNAVYLQQTGACLRSGDNISLNNGHTWTTVPMQPDFVSGLPHGYRRTPVTSVLDPFTGRLITIINAMDTPGLDPTVHEPPVALETFYLRYRVSADGGKTWGFDEPIVQAGGFTAQRPFEGVWVGKNAIYLGDLGCIPIVTRAGGVLLPAQTTPLGPDGKLWNPSGGHTYTDVLVLIGTWTNGNRLSWRASQRVVGDPKRTTRGLFEPTLAEFRDGRILMVMRGSNGGKADPRCELPGYKWFAISRDGGETWSTPAPWTFEDGQAFFSPSSMSALFRHSSGRCFWAGNLSPQNCRGNLPRWPLVVGEVDPRSLKLVHSSVLTVDTQRPEDKNHGRLDLSHLTLLEDRENKQIILAYPRSYNAYKSNEWATVRLALK
ncbi:MAG: sialidase family protein [Verrucomicrobiota bacterium]